MMHAFATLLERLVLTPSRNAKLALLVAYFKATPDPDRGYALAAITSNLDTGTVKAAALRTLATERIDSELFALSYDYVGDLAETIALIWQSQSASDEVSPSLGAVVNVLKNSSKTEALKRVTHWLDIMPIEDRYALVKLATGGLRIGLSARLAKQALADFGGKPVEDIEEVWHAQAPPYQELFAWLEGKTDRPSGHLAAPFRPVMLATPLDQAELAKLNLSDFAIEWKWDGIRVQCVCDNGVKRLYTRTGDDISDAFPDVVEAMNVDATLDGELLIGRYDGTKIALGSFGDLQQRLNRKQVSPQMRREFPATVRLYDVLVDDGVDVRSLPLVERRARLEALALRLEPSRFDLSPQLSASSSEAMAALRANPPESIIEGLMLKRLDSAYVAGRPKGPWFKWKREAMLVDAVLMYAQRGHGKRSSFYSDYTFGVWTADPDHGGTLVPVGKAYSGFTDDELKLIDKYVRDNTFERFGPVRSVHANRETGLVFEVAFEGLNKSARHKSGVAMRFPRISRVRWDKPAREADLLHTLSQFLS
jgi:DNA ligase 1